MARPNINFKIVDESIVVPISEAQSTTIGAVFNPTLGLKGMAGTTTERDQGYFFVENQSEWYTRLTNLVITQAGGVTFIEGITAYSTGSCAASYVDGTYTWSGNSAAFAEEWWPVNNFLQYGGSCYVAFSSSTTVPSGFSDLGFDIAFQGGSAGGGWSNYNTALETLINYRDSTAEPVFGVFGVGTTGSSVTITSDNISTLTGNATSIDYNACKVFGEKNHLDLTGTAIITTPLVADIAGCICRTDRESYPWFSPAGTRRGRILNVLNLKKNLAESEQNALYDAGINPVVTFAGDGTLLFGDKTGQTATSTLSRINVARLFHYVKKSLAPVARSILFEQNDSFTRSRFKIAAEAFLDRIVGQRGIQEYKVICDSTNNTAEIIEANYFVADILIKPITSINYVTITLTNKDLSSSI